MLHRNIDAIWFLPSDQADLNLLLQRYHFVITLMIEEGRCKWRDKCYEWLDLKINKQSDVSIYVESEDIKMQIQLERQ